MRPFLTVLMLALLAASCKPKAPPPAGSVREPAPSITDREWLLTSLGENKNPLGNGGMPVTLRLESQENRAGGFAGCNRYSGPYQLSGDSLSFGPAISTKMACDQGMDVEGSFLSMLPTVSRYQATDSSLTLYWEGTALATFR